MKQKTIDDISPIWSSIRKRLQKKIPAGQIRDFGFVRDMYPDIQLPCCCVVGEARGNEEYFDIAVVGDRLPSRKKGQCVACTKFSVEFFGIIQSLNYSDYEGEVKELDKKYNATIEEFVKHMNKKHRENKIE